MNDLIVVRQLPIIEEQLRTLGAAIDAKVAEATAMVCTEETVKAVKKMRADLNAQFNALEEQRKAVKSAVMEPYLAFETVYKGYVTSKFSSADQSLKQIIGEVEDGLKDEKAEELRAYFSECTQAAHLEWLPFDACDIKVTLSSSMKSLKEKVSAFVERVSADVEAIREQEHSNEIMVEYKGCFSLSRSIAIVAERHKAIEQQRKMTEAVVPIIQAEQKAAKKVEAFAPPVEVKEEKVLRVAFAAYGTLDQLKEMKRYAVEIGIRMEALQ